MNAFRTELCRILFTTEVAGMGIDFPYVERVIQWRVGAHLSISAVLQRLGRGSRSLGMQGVFILYHSRSYVINRQSDPTLAIFKTQASRGLGDSRVIECIKAVEPWSNGTFRMTPPEDPLDIPMVPFDVEPPEKVSLAPASADSYEEDSESDNDSPVHQSHLSNTDTESEEDDSASIVSVDPEYHGRQARRREYPASCRGVTWLINTEGCRRAVLLTLFDDAGYNPDQYLLSNSSVPTCCDSHLAAFRTQHADNDAVRSLIRLLPPGQRETPTAATATGSHPNSDDDARPIQRRRRNVTGLQRQKVRQALRELRLQIWEELAAGSQFIPYTPHKFLPDTYIERIVSMSSSLTTEDNLQVALAKTSQVTLLLVPFLPRILATATKAYSDSFLPARPVGLSLHPRGPMHPLHVITEDVEVNTPPTQQPMRANEQTGVEHEAREDQPDLQYQKRREHIQTRKAQQTDTQRARETVLIGSNNPYADLLPNSIPTPSLGIPSDIYDPRSIPRDLRSTLPPLGRGRPSKMVQTYRRAIIHSYWAARGYEGE